MFDDTFIYTICMKCEICGKEYEHTPRKKNKHCGSNSCSAKWNYRLKTDWYLKRARTRYWIDKETRYSVLRKINLKAKHIQRFGVEREVFIKQRGGKCQNCGSKKSLRIHHIDNQGRKAQSLGQKPNNDPSNLMLVCQRCHNLHHIYGQELKMKT